MLRESQAMERAVLTVGVLVATTAAIAVWYARGQVEAVCRTH